MGNESATGARSTARPQWFEAVGDFYATLTRRSWRAIGYPNLVGRTVYAAGVSPIGVATHVFDALDHSHRYAGVCSVRLHGRDLTEWRRLAGRCRALKRRRRKIRQYRKQRRGWR
jgi:hypothetical protein